MFIERKKGEQIKQFSLKKLIEPLVIVNCIPDITGYNYILDVSVTIIFWIPQLTTVFPMSTVTIIFRMYQVTIVFRTSQVSIIFRMYQVTIAYRTSQVTIIFWMSQLQLYFGF
jgi:hypothetical protein